MKFAAVWVCEAIIALRLRTVLPVHSDGEGSAKYGREKTDSKRRKNSIRVQSYSENSLEEKKTVKSIYERRYSAVFSILQHSD